MKKIIAMFLIFSATLNAMEIFDEFYVMENIIPFLQTAKIKKLKNKEVRIIKVDKKVLKSLGTTSDPFYFYDSKQKETEVRIGDYIISPLTLSEIYVVKKEEI